MRDPGLMRTRLLDELDSAIERNMSFPGTWYADPDIARFEAEQIIRRSWQPIGAVDGLRKPGDYLTTVFMNVPLLVVRGAEGIRAFVNICRHRGHPVASGCGTKKLFTCVYHAWTYGTDGALVRAPRAELEPWFDPSRYGLLPVRLATWGPMAFVNFDADAPAFEDEYSELMAVTEANGFGLSSMTFRKRVSWEQSCNWKTFMDNTADCYHCRTVHPGMGETHKTDPDQYVTRSYGNFAFHLSDARDDRPNVLPWMSCAVFPNWTITAAGGQIARVRVVEPVTASQIRVTTDFCAYPEVPEEDLEEDARWYHDLVYGEDRPVCESVAIGIASGLFAEGPIFLRSEEIMQDFQKKYRDRLSRLSVA
ncbi:aromatic ring-hydroxylating oxygenase subunit alpha [Propylenella binzhouense]|uniref:Aromatic ring-hydroxylating dioxygenase subunit alpha n=1 Tax=Propylenella binzhouense TaxID=2555902 RepID=A0A964T8C0_9HYPH|nr:aromatic ring-hydroxylating dioxygenase subunit alpha [Propylenella binzhouense]MYZ50423.1 aromatic ring-hydroxylating dioxygenase subunit alpha [Propylenella binzhouense]